MQFVIVDSSRIERVQRVFTLFAVYDVLKEKTNLYKRNEEIVE